MTAGPSCSSQGRRGVLVAIVGLGFAVESQFQVSRHHTLQAVRVFSLLPIRGRVESPTYLYGVLFVL
jgi:hypothetical protein